MSFLVLLQVARAIHGFGADSAPHALGTRARLFKSGIVVAGSLRELQSGGKVFHSAIDRLEHTLATVRFEAEFLN